MINSTKQLNEIVRNLSNMNANASISQLAAIIDLCSKTGIKFSYDANYAEALASFTASNFPEWNLEATNTEIESLANQGKIEEATLKREKTLLLKNEIYRQFRLEKYGTEDWFIEKSQSEIFFLPTHIAVIDSLIFEMNN
jgi:hypothetical protein